MRIDDEEKSDAVTGTSSGKRGFRFPELLPGTYRIQAMEDMHHDRISDNNCPDDTLRIDPRLLYVLAQHRDQARDAKLRSARCFRGKAHLVPDLSAGSGEHCGELGTPHIGAEHVLCLEMKTDGWVHA